MGGDDIKALAASDSAIYAGGHVVMDVSFRDGVVALDPQSGEVLGFPVSGDAVNSLALEGRRLYIGTHGPLVSGSGEARWSLAALDTVTWEFTPWAPEISGGVHLLRTSENEVFLKGIFTGGRRLAAVDKATGLPGPWSPRTEGAVSTLAPFGGDVFIGGVLRKEGANQRPWLAKTHNGPWRENGLKLSTDTYAAYQWNRDSVPIEGANGRSYTVTEPGRYTVTATDRWGYSLTSAPVEVAF